MLPSSHINLLGLRHPYSSVVVRYTQRGILKRYDAEQVFRTPCPHSKILYVILAGFAKTSAISECGGEDILGFSMPGDLIGLGNLAPDPISSEVVFLTEAVVAELPLEDAMRLEIEVGGLGEGVGNLISRELLRTQWRNRFVRHGCVKKRVAHFLLEMSQRFADIDFPSHKYRLFMPREDIAVFLCMTKSTLSRTLHMLCAHRLIDIDGRWIEIIDLPALRRM